jgi:probable O-glycosylation ligase (exosortase A-associated)
MRSLLVLILVYGSVPLALAIPHVGVLVWSWVSYMSPHRLTWGIAYSAPLLDALAGATLIGWLISKEPKKITWHPIIVLLAIYVAWYTIATIFAYNQAEAWPRWTETMKIQLFTFVSLGLMLSKNRLHALLWVIVISLGFFGMKGGLFTVLSGGSQHVWGPPGSFIADNNQLALALVMTLPMMRYLQMNAPFKWISWAMGGAMGLTIMSIFGSQSRGALLALSGMMVFMILKSRQRGLMILFALFALAIGVSFMPDSWRNRMSTIESYEQDSSAMGRLAVWEFAWYVALERPLIGGGPNVFIHKPTVDRMRPKLVPHYTIRAPHSIWFEVLGASGFVGLFLFIAIGCTAFFSARRLEKRIGDRADLKWARDLAMMFQVSLVGYAINGTFLNLSRFDLYYHFLVIYVIAHTLASRELGTATKKVKIPVRAAPASPPTL